MSNLIKYSTTAQTQALKTGDFWIATGDVLKGSTSTSGFWNGISPPTSGYTIYLNKASQGPSIYVPTSDSQLIDYTNKIGTQSFTSVTQCFNWYNTQSDKMVFNRDYPEIITSGLVLNLDAGFIPSYSTSGTTWNDTSPSGNNGTLVNGPTYDSGNSGSILFDGTNDYASVANNASLNSNVGTVSVWFKYSSFTGANGASLISKTNSNSTSGWNLILAGGGAFYAQINGTGSGGACCTEGYPTNTWRNIVLSFSSGVSCQIYQNAVLQASGSCPSFTVSTQPLRIVDSLDPFWGIMAGNIAIVQLYNRLLSASEILQNYNAIKSRFGL